MKKILLLTVLLLAALQSRAGDIDVSTAQQTASRLVGSRTMSGRHAAPAASSNIRLIHTERNSANPDQAAYYIFNTDDSYIIVAGDDRAHEILAYGDNPLDINNIPDNMQFWLDGYKQQIEYLQAHPDMVVENRQQRAPRRVRESVEPLLTALWDQSWPYYNQCPVTSNGSRCVTGCPATSLAMVFYYWKYPTEPTPTVPAFTTRSLQLRLEELPSITFDWDNMLDVYRGGASGAQVNAVAWLMRYLGQAERMDYAPDGSGSYGENILETVKLFGYDEDAKIVYKTWWNGYVNYTDEQWADLMQQELYSYRPMVMCAYTATWSGHAFNVDGYDGVNDLYHINFGWSGSGNGFCAMNAFNGSGMTFNVNQQLIVGIEPPVTKPTIKVYSPKVNIDCYAEKVETSSFVVKGRLLSGDVSLTLNDENGVFALNTDHVSYSDLEAGKRVTVTYSPAIPGEHKATVTLKSEGADDVTVDITGTAILETYVPEMLDVSKADDMPNSSFMVNWSDNTPAHNVTSYRIERTIGTYSEQKLLETFDKTEYSGTSTSDCSSKLDDITVVPGWSGSKVYRSDDLLILGNSKSKGWLETPALDMRGNYGYVTVKIEGKASGSTTNEAPIKISCGDNDTTIMLSSELDSHCVMLPCPSSKSQKVKLSSITGSRVAVKRVEVLAGDDYSPINVATAVYYDGITSTSYTMSDVPCGIYKLRVQGLYTDGSSSQWSNWSRVVIEWPRGDLNHDGEVNIADLNVLINLIFSNGEGYYLTPTTYDLTGDSEINIGDINTIIHLITERNKN